VRITIHGSKGVVDLGDLPTLNLNGGTFTASRFLGHIHNLNITSYQDERSSSSRGQTEHCTGARGACWKTLFGYLDHLPYPLLLLTGNLKDIATISFSFIKKASDLNKI
jgi:hypothetical protein